MRSFMDSFLPPYVRISRWGEIRKREDRVEKAACFLTEAALEEPVVNAVCGERAWCLLTRWENDASAWMLSLVSPHTA